MLLSLIPSGVYAAVWLVTAPEVRFGAAGPIALGGVPLAWINLTGGCPTRTANRGSHRAHSDTRRSGQQRSNPSREAEAMPTGLGGQPSSITIDLLPTPSAETESGRLPGGTPATFPASGEKGLGTGPQAPPVSSAVQSPRSAA